MTQWHLGTMGFAYEQWEGTFYPAGMSRKNFLTYYSRRFNAVEMDSTFYGTPRAKSVLRWAEITPEHFQICPKVPRAITHESGLVEAGAQAKLSEFLAVMQLLNGKLGPILVQFPPMFGFEQMETLAAFVANLPSELRFAVEFRHRSWYRKETAVLLRRHNICWTAADYIHLPKRLHRTSDFLYLRFIGPHGQFPGKDREMVDKSEDLARWWRQIQPHLDDVTDVYGFFNNDYAGYSPATTNRFRGILGLEPADIRVYRQGRLF